MGDLIACGASNVSGVTKDFVVSSWNGGTYGGILAVANSTIGITKAILTVTGYCQGDFSGSVYVYGDCVKSVKKLHDPGKGMIGIYELTLDGTVKQININGFAYNNILSYQASITDIY
jgi:hypothetical protein